MSKSIEQVLADLRGKLLDLTRRNRLLNYKDSSKSLRVIDELPNEVFHILVEQEKEMRFLPISKEDMPLLEQISTETELPVATDGPLAEKHKDTCLQTPFTNSVLERRCKKLHQESRTAIEETGSNLLHLAIGFLEWYESEDSTELNRAPLILVPAKIEKSRLDKRSNCYTYVLSYSGEDIETNLSLAEKLKLDFGILIPTIDECDSPEQYFELLSEAVINQKRWRVAREIVLSLFSFSKLLMYRDLDPARWPSIIQNKNITSVLGGNQVGDSGGDPTYGEEYDFDRNDLATRLHTILDADSSQISVILDAVHHRKNLVVEGPPGTGKSQTITNIIAAALHEGLSVLFVAEKKAALEVVRSRLNGVGLGDFCLELHSHKAQKGQLHADLAKRVLKQFHDAPALDREVEDLARERKLLLGYTDLMNSKVGPNGESIHDIFWMVERHRAETNGREVRLPISSPLSLTRSDIHERATLLKEIARLRTDLGAEAIQSWKIFLPTVCMPGDEPVLAEHIKSMVETVDGLVRFTKENLPTDWPLPLTPRSFRHFMSYSLGEAESIPPDFVQHLAQSLATPDTLSLLNELNDKIQQYQYVLNGSKKVYLFAETLELEKVQEIVSKIKSLNDQGLGCMSSSQLVELCTQHRTASQLIEALSAKFDDVHRTTGLEIGSISDIKLISKLKVTLASFPGNDVNDICVEHCLASAVPTLHEAKEISKKLVQEIKEHAEVFSLRYCTNVDDLAEIAQGIRSFRGSFFAFLSPRYRSLLQKARVLAVNPKSLKVNELVQSLERLVDTIKHRNAFSVDELYIRRLGAKFCGVDSNWEKIEQLIDWCSQLTEIVSSSTNSYNITSNFNKIKQEIDSAEEEIMHVWHELQPFITSLKIDEKRTPSYVSKSLLHDADNLSSVLVTLGLPIDLQSERLGDLHTSFKSYLSVLESRSEIYNNKYTQALGAEFNGPATNTECLLRTSNWLNNLSKSIGNPSLFNWILSGHTKPKFELLVLLMELNSKFWSQLEVTLLELSRLGELSPPLQNIHEFDGEFIEVGEVAKKWLEHIHDFGNWADYCRVLKRADELGLAPITAIVEGDSLSPAQAESLYLRGAYEAMARALIQKHPDLAYFTRASYEGVRERYAKTDRRIMQNFRDRIAYTASKRSVPAGVGYGPVKDHTDFALIKRELSKQKRHIPIRQLVGRAVRALQALKPCFMMSPLSVAQYLDPRNVSFDLLVMDEASQLKPEDALGAIGRARQLIVVGDPKQLPPSSFFDRTDAGTDDSDEMMAIESTESILDICMLTFDKRRLRWHYRSAHESLIAFSNNRFYDDDLVIFPSPLGKNCQYGLHRHYIAGAAYSKGKNRVEAEAVAKAVVQHFKTAPSCSLGVATFNREQAELILDILDKLQKEHPWFEKALKDTEGGEEPFFVKNLENVQGDERDVIFVSTTYGPDSSTGKVFQRFGPIAGESGWRRLNVIFTRAKKQLELFTSLSASDIKLGDTPSKGTVALKEYLAYAETGCLPDYGQVGGRGPDSEFEVAVTHHLNQNGYSTVAQVGVAGFFIDIGVVHPERDGEFILGIECDGATYHSAKSVRDRDRLRQEILEKKGWKIHRIWSTDWYKNRDKEVQRLLSVVRESAAEASKPRALSGFRSAVGSIIEGLRSPPEMELAQPTPSAYEPEASRERPSGLRSELNEYRSANIGAHDDTGDRGILREEILSRLVVHKPTTLDEFYKVVPIELRQRTDSRQMQYIDEILEIIEGYV